MRKLIYLTMVAVIGSHCSFGQQRKRLNEQWEFLKQDLGGVWEAVRPTSKDVPDNIPLWQKVTLPHCFNGRDGVDPDMNYYQGPGWYRTRISIDNPYRNGRTLLHFEGAGQKSTVYVYTTKVGEHLGGYDEWTVDITQAVEDFKKTDVYKNQFKGKIPVEIRCDNSRDVESIPSRLSDFNVYGGIYRYLNLVYTPVLSIDKIFASAEVPKIGSSGKLTVRARFYDPQNLNSAEGLIKLISPEGKVIDEKRYTLNKLKDEQELTWFNLKKPKLWSPDDPELYTVEVSVKDGSESFTQREKVGFRQFEFLNHGPFMLNGKRLLLKGTHRHEDHAGIGAAMTEDLIRKEMQMIKDMGANFIRLGHYQQSRIVLNLCDSLGILVWEEEPWCRGGVGGDKYKNQAHQMLTNMIEQHYNHPSIILWGLGNENDWPGDFSEFDKQKIRDFMSAQNALAHQLDPSRKTVIRRCDFASDIPDVYSPSIWDGWYKGTYTDYLHDSEQESKKVNHFIHAEWGGDSHALRHAEKPDKLLAAALTGTNKEEQADNEALFKAAARASKDNDWSESYICNLFDWHLKEQEKMPWLSGSAFWTFKDFATPLRPDNPIPYINQKGVVERDLTPKESYYVFQSYWSQKPMVHIYGHSWPIRWGDAGELKMVKVYSNCGEAELFVNGKSYGTKKRNSESFPAAGLHWLVPLTKGANRIKVIARKGNAIVTDEIKQQYQTEKWGKPAKMILEKTNDDNGISTVQVKLFDEKGIPCLDAANWIIFSLNGDGELLDDLGTSMGSRKVQAYNGRAIIRVKTNKGKSSIAVQSPGLETTFLSL